MVVLLNKEKSMVIEAKLSKQDFINATFILSYSRILTKISTGILLFFFLISIILAIVYPIYSSLEEVGILFAILFIRPVMTYFTAVRNYNSSQRTGELITYHFTPDYLSMKGESFNAEFSWDKIYKVTQSKNWVFIWQNKRFANVLSKRDIWEEQVDELKEILQKHNVKNTL
jgi:hypothetical protein